MSRWILCCIVLCAIRSMAMSQMCDPALSQVLAPPNGEEWIGLGFSIEIQGDWAYVGAGLDLVDGVDSGSVHIYHFDGTQWVDQGRIVPPDPQSLQYFAGTVSIDGDTLMIGAGGDGDIGEQAGAVYVFIRVGGQWEFAQKLTASDGRAGQGFQRVFLQGTMAVVGATGSVFGAIPGAAYVFERTDSGWIETQKLTPSDSQGGDLFGLSCMFEDDWMVLGAPESYNADTGDEGGAYVFRLEGGSWVETQKLLSEKFGSFSSDFGVDVAIANGQIIVGEPREGKSGITGRVYVFEQVGSEWVESQRLTPNSNTTRGFGFWLDVYNDRLMIGAPSYSNIGSNVVELFIDIDGTWMSGGTMVSPASNVSEIFGQRFALGEEIAMVFAQTVKVRSSVVYVYSLGCGTCDADLNGDAALDVEDVSAFLSAYSAGSMQADFTMDGTLDFFDVSAFLVEFGAGCP